jgi:putative toxin-antitoxin system antitoxin component (TIGR02293 family)
MATAAQAPLFAMQEFFEIVANSVHVFGSPSAAVEWFETPNPTLNDKTPFEALVQNGPSAVETLIGRIEHGVYS